MNRLNLGMGSDKKIGYINVDIEKEFYYMNEQNKTVLVKPDVVADFEEPLPFKDNSFDEIICFEVIEHIKNHLQFLKEIKRVLEVGGKAYFTTPNLHGLMYRIKVFLGRDSVWDWNHLHIFTDSNIKKEFAKAGWDKIRIEGNAHWFLPVCLNGSIKVEAWN